MQSLRELVSADSSGAYTTDKDTTHSYIETYDSVLAEYQEKDVNILEIGNHHGGSIKLWSDYFKNASIFGIEIGERTGLRQFDNIDNITINENTDAISFETIRMFEDLGVKFDIIIDDGSHHPAHQVFAAKFWSKFLKDDGIMIIEDVQNIEFCPYISDAFPVDFTNIETVDLRDKKGRFDDIMIIATKSGGAK